MNIPESKMASKFLLVDLDGTVRRSTNGEFINKPEEQEPIPEVKILLDKFLEKGWNIIGISNQGGIQYGYKTLADCKKEMQITLSQIPCIQEIYFCPDMDGLECHIISVNDNKYIPPQKDYNFRKPGTGMIKLIKKEFKLRSSNIILMVGDREEDRLAASNAGIDFMFVHDWVAHYTKAML